jgi:hypothetical protein
LKIRFIQNTVLFIKRQKPGQQPETVQRHAEFGDIYSVDAVQELSENRSVVLLPVTSRMVESFEIDNSNIEIMQDSPQHRPTGGGCGGCG